MTDAHCHVSCGDPAIREFLIGRDFVGIHPWEAVIGDGDRGTTDSHGFSRIGGLGIEEIRKRLEADPQLGVGEIGLDRLKVREVPPLMREIFEAQLKLAFEYHRPTVLHGAKCWGQVVQVIRNFCPLTSDLGPLTFLFHGFSRSDGLIPDIVRLNGYISVGPAVLNDHAVNYRALVKKIRLDRLLVETDRTEENAAECPSIRDVLAKTAELHNLSPAELEKITDANAESFLGPKH